MLLWSVHILAKNAEVAAGNSKRNFSSFVLVLMSFMENNAVVNCFQCWPVSSKWSSALSSCISLEWIHSWQMPTLLEQKSSIWSIDKRLICFTETQASLNKHRSGKRLFLIWGWNQFLIWKSRKKARKLEEQNLGETKGFSCFQISGSSHF